MTEKPKITLPEKGTLKFIQLYIKEKPYFRHGGGQGYHSDILEKTLKEFNLKFKLQKIDGHLLIPEPKGDDYKCVGMGIGIRWDDEVSIGESSMDYKIGPNKKHLEEISSYLPEGIKFRLNQELI